MLIAIGLTVIIVLTIGTGYFVAQEFAYVSATPMQLQQLADEGDAAAQRALKVTSKLSFTLSGAQFGITLTALLVGYLGEELLSRGLTDAYAHSDWLPAATMVSLFSIGVLIFSTVIQMVFGELAPKNYAIARSTQLARTLSRSTLVYLAIFGPIITMFDKASNGLLRLVGIEPMQELAHAATPEDLTRIINESHEFGTVDDDLSTLLGRGLAFRNRVADEAMTPRPDVITVNATDTVDQVIEAMASGRSRFPVVGSNVDDIVGVVGLHNILPVPVVARSSTTAADIADPPILLPRTMPLPNVLQVLREQHRQLAVVVDEYGGFAGIITFEDVAEEVVGEIFDEDDVDEHPSASSKGEAWEVSARLRIDEAKELTGIELPEGEHYDTLSGLVLSLLQRTAEAGDSVSLAWTTRDSNGEEIVHTTKIDVLTTSRHVPDTILLHPVTTTGEAS